MAGVFGCSARCFSTRRKASRWSAAEVMAVAEEHADGPVSRDAHGYGLRLSASAAVFGDHPVTNRRREGRDSAAEAARLRLPKRFPLLAIAIPAR
jgi:hypothetical protein